jgi:AcrR family transcriptional regulator
LESSSPLDVRTAQPSDPEPATELKKRLARAALDLFASKGFAATRVQEIADAAGATKPMVYYYFEGKEGLLRYVIRRALEEVRDRLAELDTEGRPVRDVLADLARSWMAAGERDPSVIRMWLMLRFQPEVLGVILNDETHQTMTRGFHGFLVHLIERGVAEGELHGDPGEIAMAFVLLVRSVVAARTVAPTDVRPSREAADRIVEMLLDGVTVERPRTGEEVR